MANSYLINVLLPLAIVADAMATQPQRAEAWTERVPATRSVVLNLRVPDFIAQRQLVLRLRGDALHPPRLPFDIRLPRIAVTTSSGASGIGDARLCHTAGQGDDCEPTAITGTIYAIGVTEGAAVQWQITSVDGVPVVPANRTVFVGWVRAAQ